MRFCCFDFKKILLNNIYANQIPGQFTYVESFIFASSYLCTLTTTRIIRINTEFALFLKEEVVLKQDTS